MGTYIYTYIRRCIHIFTYREKKGEGERPGYKHHIYAYSNTHACVKACSQHARRLTVSAHTAVHPLLYAAVVSVTLASTLCVCAGAPVLVGVLSSKETQVCVQ